MSTAVSSASGPLTAWLGRVIDQVAGGSGVEFAVTPEQIIAAESGREEVPAGWRGLMTAEMRLRRVIDAQTGETVAEAWLWALGGDHRACPASAAAPVVAAAIDRYGDSVVRQVRAVCRLDPDSTRDVCCDAWANLFASYWSEKAESRLVPIGPLHSLATTIAVNLVRGEVRGELRRRGLIESLAAESRAGREPPVYLEGDAVAALLETVAAAIDSLPPVEQEIFVLAGLGSITGRDASRELGKSEQHVSKAIRNARRKIAQQIEARHGAIPAWLRTVIGNETKGD